MWGMRRLAYCGGNLWTSDFFSCCSHCLPVFYSRVNFLLQTCSDRLQRKIPSRNISSIDRNELPGILLFQPQGRFDTVLAASPWQDRPPGTLFQHRYAAVILHPRSVVIWKLNCLPGRITSTLVTVSSCIRAGEHNFSNHHHHHLYRWFIIRRQDDECCQHLKLIIRDVSVHCHLDTD